MALQHEGERNLVGGYTQMSTEEIQDDAPVVAAAQFAMDQVLAVDTPNRPSYTFLENLSTTKSGAERFEIRIVRAFAQVVAGMNYRIVVALLLGSDDDDKKEAVCQGAFAVTIYDAFGTLSISQWGHEMDCPRTMAALTNDDMNDAFAVHFNS